MRFVRSLRARVAVSFALLGAVVSVALSLGLWVAGQELEQRLISESLDDELEEYATLRRHDPATPPIATRTIRSFVRESPAAESVPEALRSLGPGFHEVLFDGQEYYAKVADHGTERLYMLFNRARLEPRARELAGFLAAGIGATILATAAGGLWLARRVIAPVTELAHRVSGLRPGEPPRAHELDFPSDEVGDLARAFDRYHDRLLGFIEREHAFTADVSHELRTSLAVIEGAAEVLLAHDELPPGATRRVQRIARAAREMSEVTEALLILAREAEDASSARPRCAVNAVVDEVIADNRYLVDGKPVKLDVAMHGRVELPVERALLRILVGNLVRNAFSYTERGTVRVRLDRDGLSIEDTGPGIEPGRASRLFERHYRGGTGTGAGIGLALVKRVCDRHGWRVSLDSANGAGTHTRVEFAAAATGAAGAGGLIAGSRA